MSYSPCLPCRKLNRVAAESGGAALCGACGKPLPVNGAINELTFAELELLIAKSPIPVVVDFWAPWCGPCRSFAPVYEQASKSLGEMIVFVKINTEQFHEASIRHKIRGVPTLAVFESGSEVARQGGAMPLQGFVSWIRAAVGNLKPRTTARPSERSGTL